MKTLALLSAAAACLTLFPACEVTGDPHKGGIFWSERKAQRRLDDRQAELNDIEGDTRHVRRSNSRLEGAAARREEMLGN